MNAVLSSNLTVAIPDHAKSKLENQPTDVLWAKYEQCCEIARRMAGTDQAQAWVARISYFKSLLRHRGAWEEPRVVFELFDPMQKCVVASTWLAQHAIQLAMDEPWVVRWPS